MYFFFVNKKEGFVWSNDTINKFIKYQHNYNPHILFNVQQIQQQASEAEVNNFLTTTSWNWTPETIRLYKKNVSHNPILKIPPEESLLNDMKIYNNNAIRQILAYNNKEGKFLLNGAVIDNKRVLAENYPTTMYCNSKKDKYGNDKFFMEKKTPNSFNEDNIDINKSILNDYGYYTEEVSNSQIPILMPSFTFVKDVCNPCSALEYDNPAKNNCPFKLNVEGNTETSPLWKKKWFMN